VSNVLKPKPVSTRQLHYNPKSRRFLGDISDTHGFGRVYNDACDEGLTLVSERTGTEVVFAVTKETRNSEGETLWWDLTPVSDDELNVQCRIRLFND
jgi:hypothetical protein